MSLPNAQIVDLPEGTPANGDFGIFYSLFDGITKKFTIAAQGTSTQNYEWVNTQTYALDEIVTYGGLLWQSLQNSNTGNIPTEGAFWTEISKSASSSFAEWTAGVYVNDNTYVIKEIDGIKLIFKITAAVPFVSSDFETEWSDNQWELIKDRTYYIAEKAAHGFVQDDVLKFTASGWAKYNGTDEAIAIVRQVVSADLFIIIFRGSLLKDMSGLTPGAEYYIQNDGTISTTASDHKVFVALSATRAVLLGGGGGGAADGNTESIEGVYATIAALLADQGNQRENALYYVTDASTDTTVDTGWAIYRKLAASTADLSDYVKVQEQESIDIVITDATPSVKGIAKLYSDLSASNTDGAVTQAGVKTVTDAKASLASPTFTGTPAAPTAAQGNDTTQLATTAFVQQELYTTFLNAT